MELREEATKEDALDVVEIMRFCMRDILNNDDSEAVDVPKSQSNLKNTSRNQVKSADRFVYKKITLVFVLQINALLNILQRKADNQESRLFSVDQLRHLCEDVGIKMDKINSTIETLNLQGFLLNKGQGNYQLVSSNFI